MIMSHKRHSEDAKLPSHPKRLRIPSLKNVVLEVMKIQSVHHFLEPVLEPLIRRVVREEVELALRKYLISMKWHCGKEVHPPELRARNLQLKFTKNLSLPIFTAARIEAEDSSGLQVALIDALTGKVVNESSGRVEIVVLEGDFDGDQTDNWTPEEFKSNIVREREGKKPLLSGDAFVNLEEGIGLVGDVCFADNSSWTRSRRFRLGARVVDSSDGTIVKEAKTEPFVVRDHRGELYKKHYPPSLLDEVWRLEKIGKDGAFHKRLARENITTVKDFLTMLFLDSSRLRNILGTGMSTKMWEVTVEHARTCLLDKKIYLYYPTASPHKTGVVFNVVGQLTGLLSQTQYVPVAKLSETQQAEAQHMILSAFQHWDQVASFDNEASLTSGFDYPSSPDVISPIYSIGSLSSLEDIALHGMESGCMNLRYSQTPSYPVASSMICDTESITQAFNDDHLQYFDTADGTSSLESHADLHSALNSFLMYRSVDKAQRRWRKLISVLKWFSLKRELASKKKVWRFIKVDQCA